MKDFLKTTLAVITGIVISSIFMSFMMIIFFAAIMASGSKPATISDNTVLILKTGTPIPDRGNPNPTLIFDQQSMKFGTVTGLNDIISNLRYAADDSKIKGVIIEPGLLSSGWATAGEIRTELLRFRESGKFVISYTDYLLNQESYYISTAADYIYLNPMAGIDFQGLSAEVMFYKNALDKIGVEMQVIRHGTFKGAVEPFMYDRLSPENRQQIASYTGSIWNHVTTEISDARNIPIAELNRIADNMLATDSEKALELGMIDGLIYRDALIDTLKQKLGLEDKEKIKTASMAKYAKAPRSSKGKSPDEKIAVIYASGNIVMGSGSETSIGGDKYASLIRQARRDSTVKAIVLRINSPGGNAIASEIIWRELDLARQVKPVVVSMGNYAASGGYFIAAPATKIITNPSTLTGSIGVFGLIPNVSVLLNEKVGITTEVVKTNRHSDAPSLTRPMSSFEAQVMQQGVERIYDAFITHVANGRDKTPEEVDHIGQGRVWSGSESIDIGLTDRFGGLQDAVETAAELAELTEWKLEELPEIVDPYTRLIQELTGEATARLALRKAGPFARFISDIGELSEMEGIQARIPYFINIR